MIKINLLPPELAGKKKSAKAASKSGPSMIAYLILIPVYLLTFFSAYQIWLKQSESSAEVDKNKKQLASLEKKFNEEEKHYKDLKETYSILNDQVEILRALDPPDRLLWSEKINMISELIPKGVFITKIEVTEQVDKIETADSKKRMQDWNKRPKNDKGPKPEVVMKPVIKQTLLIDGITYKENSGSEERLDLIVKFYQALQNFQWQNHKNETRKFMDNFNQKITFQDIKDTKVSDVEVSKFTFILTTKPFTAEIDQEEQAPAPAASAPSKEKKAKDNTAFDEPAKKAKKRTEREG